MEMRLEKRNGFTISGYLIETVATDDSYAVKSLALREKYGAVLKMNATIRYGATWFTNDGNLYYLFGVEQVNEMLVGDNNIIIPKGLFAVATVPVDMPLMHAWNVMWETGLPSIGYNYIEGEKCFERFGENNVREIWVPVVKSEEKN